MEQPPSQPPYNQPPQQPTLSAAGGFDSPFEVAGGGVPQNPPPAPAPSPFEIAQEPVQAAPDFSAPLQATPGSPFETAPPQAQVPVPAQAPVPSGPIPTPSEPEPLDLPPGALEDPREFVELNVSQLLGSVPPHELGVAGVNVSPFAVALIPMAMLKPQLPTGQVFLNVSDVIVGCKPEHRAALAGCNPMVRVKVPIALIFPTQGSAIEPVASAGIPAGVATPPIQDPAQPGIQAPLQQQQAPVSPSPFDMETPAPQVGIGMPAIEPAASGQLPAQQQLPPHQPLQQLPPSPFDDSPPAQPQGLGALPSLGTVGESQTVPPVQPTPPVQPPPAAEGAGSPLSALPPLGGIATQPALPAEAPVSPEPAPQLPPMMPANGGLAPTSFTGGGSEIAPATAVGTAAADGLAPTAGGAWPYEETKTEAPSSESTVVESLESLAPVQPDGAHVAPQGFGQAPVEDAAQLALRGLFLCGGKLSPTSVVGHCVDLPGVESCIVLGRDGQLCAQAPQGGDLASEGPRIHRSLQDLSSATGAGQSEALTIRTSDAMVSFFTGDGLSIGVKHELQGFRPGVSERLTLIARQLGQLAQEH